MKNKLFKIKAILVSVIILLSSNTYAVTSHFCGSELVSISYMGSSLTCGMETDKNSCDSKPKVKKACCKDVVEILEPQTLDKTLDYKLTYKQFKFSVAFIHSYLSLFKEVEYSKEYYKEFPPPDLEQNYQVLYQIFLI